MEFEKIIADLNFSHIFWQITTPLLFSCADVVTGYIQAIINKNLDSKKMRQGLLRKFLLVIVIVLSFVMHLTFNLPIISKIFCMYIIIMEIISIIENLTKAGLNLGKLSSFLKITNNKEE